MKNWYLTIAVLALTILQVACTQTPPPSPDSRAADEKAIRDQDAESLKAVQAKEFGKIARIFCRRCVPPGTLHAHPTGQASDWRRLEGHAGHDCRYGLVPVQGGSCKGRRHGLRPRSFTWTFTDPKTKKPMMEKGKFLSVLKKQADGSWKTIQDMFNADSPATPAK